MSSPQLILTVCLTALATLPIGFALGKVDRGREVERATTECEPQASAQAEAAAGLDARALRKLLREELRAERASETIEAEKAPEQTAESEAKAEQADEARARADELVESALRTKRWSRSDDLTLHQLFASMEADQIAELSSRLFPAMNRGEIEPLHLTQ